MPKTLAEIAIEAGLVNKANAARAGRLADERKEPLVVTMIKELGIDEVALAGAIRKQTRVPLIDPAEIPLEPEALRLLSRDVCARLRVLPLGVSTDGTSKIVRVAMADPTDTAAVLEVEQLTQAELEVSALPLSAIEELVEKGYRQINTAVLNRPTASVRVGSIETESEVSVTAQIPISSLQPPVGADDLEARLTALTSLLVAKGLITEAELAEALRVVAARNRPPSSGT